MPCCRASDPYAGIRAFSQSQRHGRKPWRGVKVVVLLLHVLFIGAVFLLDPTLQRRIHEAKWCMILYGVLVLLTLVQYLYTDNSSPGYLADMLRAGSGMHETFINTKRQVSSKNGSLNSAMSRSKIEQQNPQYAASSSFLPVMDLHPPGSSSSLHTPSTVMIVINVFSNSIITVFGLGRALAKGIIADFGEFLARFIHSAKVFAETSMTCAPKGYVLEAVPPLEELEARARPYTCRDVICCRCC